MCDPIYISTRCPFKHYNPYIWKSIIFVEQPYLGIEGVSRQILTVSRGFHSPFFLDFKAFQGHWNFALRGDELHLINWASCQHTGCNKIFHSAISDHRDMIWPRIWHIRFIRWMKWHFWSVPVYYFFPNIHWQWWLLRQRVPYVPP